MKIWKTIVIWVYFLALFASFLGFFDDGISQKSFWWYFVALPLMTIAMLIWGMRAIVKRGKRENNTWQYDNFGHLDADMNSRFWRGCLLSMLAVIALLLVGWLLYFGTCAFLMRGLSVP